MTAEDLIWKLYDYFNVKNNIELAEKIKATPQTISNWKSRNSIDAIKNKCRELGIYNEILGDTNIQKIKSITGGQNAQNVYGGMNNNTPANQSIDDLQIPKLMLIDLNNLFNLANEKDKQKDLINKLDDFIYQTKKEYR